MGLQAATSVTAELLITEAAEKPVSEASTPRVSICSRSRHFSPGSAAPDIWLRATKRVLRMSVYGPRWPATTMPPPKAESSASKPHRAQERQARDGFADGGRNNHQGHEGTRSLDAFPS